MKLMTLGFGCEIPILLGKAKKYKLDQTYNNYEIGLFDWSSIDNPNTLELLLDKQISKDLDSCNYTVKQSYSSKQELCMYIAGIEYPHVKKLKTIKESIKNYDERLRYLEQKTLNHYLDNQVFIANFSSKITFGNDKLDLNDFISYYKSSSLLNDLKLICLIDKNDKIKTNYDTFKFIRLDRYLNLHKATKTEMNEYSSYLINRISKLENFYDNL